MKKILGFITTLGVVSSVTPTVIACSNNHENSYKIALTKLINQVETVIAANPEDDKQEIRTLKLTLLRAKDVQAKNPTEDYEYIKILNLLTEDLNDYQTPGYKKAKERLKCWIKDANRAILNDREVKSPEVIDNLANAIDEAETALNNESDCKKIIIAERHLIYHLRAYEEWDWNKQYPKSN